MRKQFGWAASALIAALFCGLCAPLAAAQTYPEKPIHLVVPFAAGGSPDVIARIVGDELTTMLGQSVIVENRAGAGGNIAAQYVLEQPADGYTLFFGTTGNLATNKVLYRKLKFDPETDFVPISVMYASCNVLIVPADSAIKSITDLVAAAKARPGVVSFGSPGIGTAGHLVGELFKTRTGTNLVHVPYRGQAQVINDLLGGHLSLSFEAVATAIPVVQSGKMRGLATTCPQRVTQIPDIPTFAEVGIRDFQLEAMAILAAHAKTPAPIVERLNQAMVKIIGSPAVANRINGMGVQARSSTPQMAREILRADLKRWRDVVDSAGIPPMD